MGMWGFQRSQKNEWFNQPYLGFEQA
jgi:hypothetical protein